LINSLGLQNEAKDGMFDLETGTTRRGFLSSGAALGAFMLPQVSWAFSAAGSSALLPRKAKSVIFLLLEGGMSHLDTWDLKPHAPQEIRGEFQQITTRNRQLRISEHMPRLAQQAHLYNVVRSVHSAARNDSPGLHWILTGYDAPRASVNGEKTNRYPSVEAVVAHEFARTSSALPRFVAVPNRRQLGGRVGYAGANHLGTAYEAFNAGDMPVQAGGRYVLPAGITLPQEMSLQRLGDRRNFLKVIDRLQRGRDRLTGTLTDYQNQAFDLLLGKRGQDAFDINREPIDLRRRYGGGRMGQGTLMARRLVEAEVIFVLVIYSKNNSWDTHKDNFERLKNRLLPPMDRAVSTLLADLEDRRLLDETLVVLIGEMGRTPRINARGAGRDHWPDVYSVMLAGGGLRRRLVLGSSTGSGEKPGTRPVHVREVLATLYHQLGIDPGLQIRDSQNRPVSILPEAHPVRELIA
jgi:Protein of unknown function (DUF1501)